MKLNLDINHYLSDKYRYRFLSFILIRKIMINI